LTHVYSYLTPTRLVNQQAIPYVAGILQNLAGHAAKEELPGPGHFAAARNHHSKTACCDFSQDFPCQPFFLLFEPDADLSRYRRGIGQQISAEFERGRFPKVLKVS
jgi:hypothetical protein